MRMLRSEKVDARFKIWWSRNLSCTLDLVAKQKTKIRKDTGDKSAYDASSDVKDEQ